MLKTIEFEIKDALGINQALKVLYFISRSMFYITFPSFRYNTQSCQENHHRYKKEAQGVAKNFFLCRLRWTKHFTRKRMLTLCVSAINSPFF